MWCCSALHRTFVNPEATQEQADLLGLPFSTYRAHLRKGTKRVTELLWQQGSCPLRRTIPRRTNLRLAHLRAREPAGGG